MPKAIRQIRVDGNIAYVPLTQGCEAVIDAADVPFVDGRNWYAERSRQTMYARTNLPTNNGKRVGVRMHCLILEPPGGTIVDHISGDGLDNRRSNLRAATAHQNQRNARRRKDNTSSHKGVYLDKATGKWRAQIYLNNAKHRLGYFTTKEAAAAAYAAASAKLHGEFGRTA